MTCCVLQHPVDSGDDDDDDDDDVEADETQSRAQPHVALEHLDFSKYVHVFIQNNCVVAVHISVLGEVRDWKSYSRMTAPCATFTSDLFSP